MADYVVLLGAEAVQSAGNQMASAAQEMNRAAASIEESLDRHRRFLDDWLERIESMAKRAEGRS